MTALRYTEKTVGGKSLVAVASKGENSTATSVALDTIRKEPGSKAVIVMLADAHKAANPKETEYIGWYYQTDFEYLNDLGIEQIVIQGATNLDLLPRLRMANIDPAKLHMVETPEQAAQAVDPMSVDSVFWAFDIFNGGDVEKSRELIGKKIEEASDVR